MSIYIIYRIGDYATPVAMTLNREPRKNMYKNRIKNKVGNNILQNGD